MTPLIAREPELAALDATLDGLRAGRTGALELAGEPGIGKTRLLAELSTRADARGHLVLGGAASELEHDLPFGVFVEALEAHVRASDPALADLLPGRPGGVSTLPQERYRIHHAVRELLEALAPLVLVLDDVHWADSGSIELLGSLLHRMPAAPVLIAVAARPRQLPERLVIALERARRAGDLTRLELRPLSLDETRELLGDSAALADVLHAESGGNPFYLEQLTRSDRPADLTPATALIGEFVALAPRDRALLDGAAVAGDPFEPELAAAAADLPCDIAMDALDELLRRDLVRTTEAPRRFRFRHPLVRQAVYATAPGGWRLAAHERCAGALARRGAPAVVRAHHVEHAGRYGDEAAIALLREAGETVAALSPAGAAHWFTAALRLVPEATVDERRLELLRALGRALAATGRFSDARTALLDAIRIAPTEVQTDLTAECAAIERLLGLHDEAYARLEAALDPDSPTAAPLMVDLAATAFHRNQLDDALAWATRAVECARGERAPTAAALAMLALTCALHSPGAAAGEYCDAAAALVDAMPDDELALRLDAAGHLAAAESYLERFTAGAGHARRGLDLARRTGQGELLPILIPALSTVYLALGRITDALELLDGAVEGARLTGNVQALAWNLVNRAMMLLLAGDLTEALALANEAVEHARELDAGVITVWAGAMRAFALIELGRHASGVALLVRCAGGVELPLFGGAWRAFCLERLTGALLELGRPADARRAADAAAAVAAASGLHHPTAMALRAEAAIALAAGNRATAAEHALASAAAADAIGASVEAACARTLAGRALDGAAAIEQLELAASVLHERGAVRYRAAAERELRRLGARRPRRTRPPTGASGIDSLTGREREIARLIVERNTNPQIAAQLFLSRKTVETHVRNLFHKLGVSSRVDVARLVEGHVSERRCAGFITTANQT